MATAKIAQKKTSVAIIGGGLSGLTLAASLERAGIDYLIFEAQSEFGGLIKGQLENGLWLDYGLKSLPVDGEMAKQPLVKLKEALNLNIPIESWTEAPLTQNKSEWIPFVGFGAPSNKTRQLIEELTYYTQSPRVTVSGGWNSLVTELLAMIPEKRRRVRCEVNQIKTTDGKVSSILVNGDTEVSARYFVFTLSPSYLKDLLPAGALTSKHVQKISKTEPLTVASLDIVSPRLPMAPKNLLVLQDGVEDPTYVIGQFISQADPMRQTHGGTISTWMTLVAPEIGEEDEEVSKVIRNMKRVVKKAFPELFGDSCWERILVATSALGQFDQLPVERTQALSGFSNLFVCGGQTPGKYRNVGAAIDSALSVAAELETAAKTVAPEIRASDSISLI
ncbi:MAG: FAD-dependent oxidoreductase [Oligoflexia bacterium]|nr:FAD-dependent oxidoreductase [Oligoflexia bacterium]